MDTIGISAMRNFLRNVLIFCHNMANTLFYRWSMPEPARVSKGNKGPFETGWNLEFMLILQGKKTVLLLYHSCSETIWRSSSCSTKLFHKGPKFRFITPQVFAFCIIRSGSVLMQWTHTFLYYDRAT